jgi:integrase
VRQRRDRGRAAGVSDGVGQRHAVLRGRAAVVSPLLLHRAADTGRSVAGGTAGGRPATLTAAQRITKADARALLDGCDRRSALGRRDYAMLVTLLRLGLRAGEVARLGLDDINWRAGELVVRGEGAREDRLPLPAEAGQAIACYLRRGRPARGRREVFLRARAPFGPIAPGTVSSTVRRACRRAGVAEVGAHRLRHTVACEMVAAGVPLADIAQVLRHHSLQTTALSRAGGPGPAAGPGRAVAGKRAAMNALSSHGEDYLQLRRALGFKLERAGQLLPQMMAYLETAGAGTVTSDLAIAWARLPDATPSHWAQRLAAAGGSR